MKSVFQVSILNAPMLNRAIKMLGLLLVFESLMSPQVSGMILAFVFRIIAPQVYPASYTLWLYLAASCWFICFAMIAWRYIPFLMQPRVDGKEH